MTFRLKLKEAVIKYGTVTEAKMLGLHDCPGSHCCVDYKGGDETPESSTAANSEQEKSRSPTPPARPAGVKRRVYDPVLGKVVTVGGEDSDSDEEEPKPKVAKTEPEAAASPKPGTNR